MRQGRCAAQKRTLGRRSYRISAHLPDLLEAALRGQAAITPLCTAEPAWTLRRAPLSISRRSPARTSFPRPRLPTSWASLAPRCTSSPAAAPCLPGASAGAGCSSAIASPRPSRRSTIRPPGARKPTGNRAKRYSIALLHPSTNPLQTRPTSTEAPRLQGFFGTGATGLEPATSGVTASAGMPVACGDRCWQRYESIRRAAGSRGSPPVPTESAPCPWRPSSPAGQLAPCGSCIHLDRSIPPAPQQPRSARTAGGGQSIIEDAIVSTPAGDRRTAIRTRAPSRVLIGATSTRYFRRIWPGASRLGTRELPGISGGRSSVGSPA
jgi:hypothetical protein